MIKREDLKGKVPHGYVAVIAKRAGVTSQAVSNYLNGRKDSERIELATLEVLAELSEKKKELLAKIIS